MIPSDRFFRFYNEVFKALEARGREHLVAFWRELGRLQAIELADTFRSGGLAACHAYGSRIVQEENCEADLTLTADYFERPGCPPGPMRPWLRTSLGPVPWRQA